jgi:hypothetical protein
LRLTPSSMRRATRPSECASRSVRLPSLKVGLPSLPEFSQSRLDRRCYTVML